MTTQAEGLARHLAAEDAHDVDAIMATFAPDAVLGLNGELYRGHALIRTVHERFGFGGTGAFSDLRVEERRRHVSADTIVLEQTLSGRHTGRWEGLAATGRRFALAICTVYRLDVEGRLVSEMVYFDRALLGRQLTAAPDRTPGA